jgi:hypothetical protein
MQRKGFRADSCEMTVNIRELWRWGSSGWEETRLGLEGGRISWDMRQREGAEERKQETEEGTESEENQRTFHIDMPWTTQFGIDPWMCCIHMYYSMRSIPKVSSSISNLFSGHHIQYLFPKVRLDRSKIDLHVSLEGYIQHTWNSCFVYPHRLASY